MARIRLGQTRNPPTLDELLASYKATASTLTSARSTLQLAHNVEQMARVAEANALELYVMVLELVPQNQAIIDMAASTVASTRAAAVTASNNVELAQAAFSDALANYNTALAALQAALPP